MSERDCKHGRQIGKCADCDNSELEQEIDRLQDALATARKEALEEAARIAEKHNIEDDNGYSNHIATEIRIAAGKG